MVMWQHDFLSLANIDQVSPPSPMERAKLMQAGLGLKSLSFPDCCGSDYFHQELIDAFPRLQEAGGYELLRTGNRGNNYLDIIPVPSKGYSVVYLKGIVGQAKVYIRPLQQGLSLECPEADSSVISMYRVCYIIIAHILDMRRWGGKE